MPSVVTLYTRKDCHLCEEAHAVLKRAQRRVSFQLEVRDIDADPALRSMYNDEVPVIAIEGKKAFKYRVDEKEFLKRLAART
jgi:glutaredoxin